MADKPDQVDELLEVVNRHLPGLELCRTIKGDELKGWTRDIEDGGSMKFYLDPADLIELAGALATLSGYLRPRVFRDSLKPGDELVARDDADGTCGRACARCGAWIGDLHLDTCDPSTDEVLADSVDPGRTWSQPGFDYLPPAPLGSKVKR